MCTHLHKHVRAHAYAHARTRVTHVSTHMSPYMATCMSTRMAAHRSNHRIMIITIIPKITTGGLGSMHCKNGVKEGHIKQSEKEYKWGGRYYPLGQGALGYPLGQGALGYPLGQGALGHPLGQGALGHPLGKVGRQVLSFGPRREEQESGVLPKRREGRGSVLCEVHKANYVLPTMRTANTNRTASRMRVCVMGGTRRLAWHQH